MPPPARVTSCCLGEVLAVPRVRENGRRHGARRFAVPAPHRPVRPHARLPSRHLGGALLGAQHPRPGRRAQRRGPRRRGDDAGVCPPAEQQTCRRRPRRRAPLHRGTVVRRSGTEAVERGRAPRGRSHAVPRRSLSPSCAQPHRAGEPLLRLPGELQRGGGRARTPSQRSGVPAQRHGVRCRRPAGDRARRPRTAVHGTTPRRIPRPSPFETERQAFRRPGGGRTVLGCHGAVEAAHVRGRRGGARTPAVRAPRRAAGRLPDGAQCGGEGKTRRPQGDCRRHRRPWHRQKRDRPPTARRAVPPGGCRPCTPPAPSRSRRR